MRRQYGHSCGSLMPPDVGGGMRIGVAPATASSHPNREASQRRPQNTHTHARRTHTHAGARGCGAACGTRGQSTCQQPTKKQLNVKSTKDGGGGGGSRRRWWSLVQVVWCDDGRLVVVWCGVERANEKRAGRRVNESRANAQSARRHYLIKERVREIIREIERQRVSESSSFDPRLGTNPRAHKTVKVKRKRAVRVVVDRRRRRQRARASRP